MDVVVGVASIVVGACLPFLVRRLAWMRESMNRRLYGSGETGRRVDVLLAAAIGFGVVLLGVAILLDLA
jgi:hypothetical protein